MRIIFIGLFFLLAMQPGLEAQELPWSYTATGISHTIFLAAENVPSVDGTPIAAGDYIGVFYRGNDQRFENAGYTRWEGESTYLTAYGNDGLNKGFSAGDSLFYFIWKTEEACQVPVDKVGYFSGGIYVSAGLFEPDGISGLEYLKGVIPSVNYPKFEICITDNVMYPVISTHLTNSIIFRSGDTGLKINSQTGAIDIKNSQPGVYQVYFETDVCLRASSLELRIHASVPEIPLSEILVGCGSILLDAGNPGSNYLWSTGDSSQSIEVSESGTYTVEVQNIFGCVAAKEVKVIISPAMVPDALQYEVQYEACREKSKVQINTATFHGGIPPYSWKVVDFQGQEFSSVNGSFQLSDDVYDLIITDSVGCQMVREQFLTVRNTKECSTKVISPNSDGMGESLYIPESGVARIYDRLGNFKNQLQVPGDWNGKDIKGQSLPTGSYLLVINGTKTYTVTIVR